jgi:hypothetical protein
MGRFSSDSFSEFIFGSDNAAMGKGIGGCVKGSISSVETEALASTAAGTT